MDFSLARTLNSWAYRHDLVSDWARFFARDGVWLLVGLVVVTFLLAGHVLSLEARGGAALAGFGMLLALAIGQVISGAVDRSRPFVDHPGRVHLLMAHSRDPGFPSDHATGAFAIAFGLLAADRRIGRVALLLAAAIAISRIAVGAHYPTDVLAGAALGGVAVLVIFATPLRRLTDGVAAIAGAAYDRALSIGPRFGSQS
jgi:undecaprenyl-diphosphatase